MPYTLKLILNFELSYNALYDFDPARLDNACTHLGDAVIDPAIMAELDGADLPSSRRQRCYFAAN
jgi:hypothetical protein